MMTRIGDSLRMSLQKREEALNRHKVRKEEYLQKRKDILNDIEEARTIWIETLSKLPDPDFSQ
jgi:hypothetical protein